MPNVTVEAALSDQFRDIRGAVKYCDTNGDVGGRYEPCSWDRPDSDEEPSRIRDERGGRPLAELPRDLESNAWHFEESPATG